MFTPEELYKLQVVNALNREGQKEVWRSKFQAYTDIEITEILKRAKKHIYIYTDMPHKNFGNKMILAEIKNAQARGVDVHLLLGQDPLNGHNKKEWADISAQAKIVKIISPVQNEIREFLIADNIARFEREMSPKEILELKAQMAKYPNDYPKEKTPTRQGLVLKYINWIAGKNLTVEKCIQLFNLFARQPQKITRTPSLLQPIFKEKEMEE